MYLKEKYTEEYTVQYLTKKLKEWRIISNDEFDQES
jgi:hypothetical protein